MRRVPYFIGLPTGRSASWLANISRVSVERQSPKLWLVQIETPRATYDIYAYRVARNIPGPASYQSVASNGRWDAYAILPKRATGNRDGERTFRLLARFSSSPQNDVDGKKLLAGPFSPRRFKEILPTAVGNALFPTNTIPWVIAGESPEDMFASDYRPTQDDIDNDTDVVE